MRRRLLLLFLAGLCVSAEAFAQDAPAPDSVGAFIQVELRDGSRYVGTVMTETADTLQVRTLSGIVVSIPLAYIESRRIVRGRIQNGRFLPFDPNRTRLFFAPTARPLGAGQGYLADYWVILGQVAVGITDRVTISGGALLIPESWGDFFYLAPKVTLYDRPRASVAIGAFAGFVNEDWGDDGIGTFGIVYGVGTLGHPDGAISIGAGFAYAEGEMANSPTLVLGLERGLSRRVKLISENWFFPSAGVALFSGGVRFFGSRIAADLALVGFSEAGGAVPWLGFAYNFGH